MLAWLPGPIKGLINLSFIVVHTIFWSMIIYLLVFAKFLIPSKRWRFYISGKLLDISVAWVCSNNLMIKIMGLHQSWDIQPLPKLNKDEWLFITCNHQSWVDPLIVASLVNKKAPPFKIFIKDVLKYLPFLGIVFVALEFPRLKRYDKETLKKKPHLRGQDIQTTLKYCQKALSRPTSLFSFIEGTRFTKQKHKKQNSPFKHLLLPKPGGFALTIQAMKSHITHLLHITIIYEDKKSFWDYLCGRVKNGKVLIEKIEIPKEFFKGDYQQDETYRANLKAWLYDIWDKKDKSMQSFLS